MGKTRSNLLVGQAVCAYLDALASGGHATGTLRSYRTAFGCLAQGLGENRNIRHVTTADLNAYLAAFRARAKSPSYPSLVARIFKGFFRWLTENGEIKVNPMDAIKPKRPPWNPVPPFSDADLHRILEAVSIPMERAIVLLLLDTGVRVSELAGLTLGDVNLELNLLRVMGKGGKVRTLALNEEPRKALEAYLDSATARNGYLWPEGFNDGHVRRICYRLGRVAGVAHVYPHRFRHTFASRFLAETGNALALQALLGHTSLIMVQRYIAAAQAEIALNAHRQHSLLSTLAQPSQEGVSDGVQG